MRPFKSSKKQMTLLIIFLITDNNECDTDNGGCSQICTDIIGSYKCSCNTGYNLGDDNHGCTGLSYTILLESKYVVHYNF